MFKWFRLPSCKHMTYNHAGIDIYVPNTSRKVPCHWFVVTILLTVHRKILVKGKIGEFSKSWAIRQNTPCQYSQIPQKCIWHVMCTDCSLFAKFFLANSFHLYSLSNLSSPNIFHVEYSLCDIITHHKHWAQFHSCYWHLLMYLSE